MVFSTVPVYHQDPPNWHLHLQQQESITGNNNPQLPPLPPPSYGGGGSGSDGNRGSNIRAGSMSDRARVAKIPQPEVALKCPRCDSTNTKFCYFNNYNLTQPRHFCKTCRRYWTKGGSLRNVPVGGGCRRNKKTNKSSSKSDATTSNSSATSGQRDDNYNYMRGHQNYPQQPPQLPFLSSLQNLTHFRSIEQGQSSNMLSADQQWSSMQHYFPFMETDQFDHSRSAVTISGNNPSSFQNGVPVTMMTSGETRVSDQVGAGAVKREETLNSGKAEARPFLGIGDEQYYNSSWGATWNNATGSGDGDDDQMPAQQTTTHFL